MNISEKCDKDGTTGGMAKFLGRYVLRVNKLTRSLFLVLCVFRKDGWNTALVAEWPRMVSL